MPFRIFASQFDANTAKMSSEEFANNFLQFSRKSLHPSTWPLDHGDSARSKFIMGAGLPKDVSSANVKLMMNLNLKGVQWLYTAGNNSNLMYTMSGDSISGFQVSKLDATTLEILQNYELERSMYTGGILIHENGHVYAIHSNNLYVYWNGDLTNSTKLRLPSNLNGKFVLTNGMLVTSDGYLLIKQWSFTISDISLILASKTSLLKAFYVLAFIVIATLAYLFTRGMRASSGKRLVQILAATVLGYGLAILLGVGIMIAILRVAQGEFSIVRFIQDGMLSESYGGGELKLIDPITLKVHAEAELPERCSFARMALSTITNAEGIEEDVISLLGKQFVLILILLS
jgi:hypothetical protein